MRVSVELNKAAIAALEKAAKEAAVATGESLREDLINSKTMPFDTGTMQNDNTFVENRENGAVIVTSSAQARRLYYHPEYNFQKGKNPNAGAQWFEPYISGDKKDFAPQVFKDEFKKRSGL